MFSLSYSLVLILIQIMRFCQHNSAALHSDGVDVHTFRGIALCAVHIIDGQNGLTLSVIPYCSTAESRYGGDTDVDILIDVGCDNDLTLFHYLLVGYEYIGLPYSYTVETYLTVQIGEIAAVVYLPDCFNSHGLYFIILITKNTFVMPEASLIASRIASGLSTGSSLISTVIK